jgi:hypothetical protein
MKPGVWIAIGVAIFVAVLISSTMNQRKYRVEACVEFNGRTNCAIAAGPDEAQALRTAVQTACATIAAGMTESMACDRTAPKSVRWLEGKQ